jgi:GNAT superfamily N-acetyltransferase
MKNKPRIEEVDTGAKFSFEFSAHCTGSPSNHPGEEQGRCGFIRATRKKLRNRIVYYVTNIWVNTNQRRKGVATSLYEAAAKEACLRRSRLASMARNPGAFSHDFWEKQHSKGRVEAYKQKGYKQPAYILDCSVTSLDGSRRR